MTNQFVINKLIKLTILWTTGPRWSTSQLPSPSKSANYQNLAFSDILYTSVMNNRQTDEQSKSNMQPLS